VFSSVTSEMKIRCYCILFS